MPRRCRVRFGQAATGDLDRTSAYIGQESGTGRARAVIARVVAGCRRLEHAPSLGRAVPELGQGFRLLIVDEFKVVYRIMEAGRVEIVRVIDSRRDFPKAWRGPDPDAHS